MHLLLHGTLIAWLLDALHAYAPIWLWGFALGPRAFPHRIGASAAILRNGPMYRVQVPLTAIAGATARRQRVGGDARLVERDGTALLAARGRVDVRLVLAEPARVPRPFREPLTVCRLAIASDDPDVLVEQLLRGAALPHRGRARPVTLPVLHAAGVLRDAMQPA